MDIDSIKETNELESYEPDKVDEKQSKTKYEGIKDFIYVGPSLPGESLKQNAVLNGTYDEILEYYETAFSRYPKGAKLIVPIGKLVKSKSDIDTQGTLLNKYYNETVGHIKEKQEV